MPRIVYATDEERQAARKEKQRLATAARRAKKAEAEGRDVKSRLKYATNEERIEAQIKTKRKADKKYNKKRPKNTEPWTPKFIGVDGESFITGTLPNGEPEQTYCLLLRHDKAELYNPKGLSTWDCLDYLTTNVPSKTALVGYFLNFDFEWILKDVYQKEYKDLQHGKEVSIYADEYRLQWFVGKKLVIKRVLPSARRLPPEERKAKHFKMVSLQDVSGFFQSSFVSALEKWGFENDERLHIIKSGKAARGGFEIENFDEVNKYNKTEMELLEELMLKVYDSFKAAYETAGLKFSVNSTSWSGPGVFANDFLKQTEWADEHQPTDATEAAQFADEFKEFFGNEAALPYPYSLSYFGGRIELAGVGKFGKVFNYDINSAYPYALSLLPRFTPEDFKLYNDVGHITDEYTQELLSRRLIGMYGVRFNFPEGWTWYPFPVRTVESGAPNVFYPRQGYTNIMSPELFAALDTLTEDELQYISISYAFVLEESDGYGDALTRMDVNKLCQTAKKTLEMADFRLVCKAAGKRLHTPDEKPEDALLATAEKALKLILNSLYGKTVQQVGSHKYYNDFASAWITSTCRALLWRALAPEKATNNILMTMTDGIYSQVPLKFAEERITTVLGDWEKEEFTYFETFKPGIYRYEDKKGMHYKVRGFLTPTTEDKETLFNLIWQSVSRGTIGNFPSRQFMSRNLALIGWKNEAYVRQFMTSTKVIESELKAKRVKNPVTGWIIPEGEQHVFFKPKREHDFNDSKGYSLDFENSKVIAKEESDADLAMMYWDSLIGFEEFYEAS
jgi:hypothetical protein